MSWICENCSSFNEDLTTECFICGHIRSRKDILIEKRAQREVKVQQIIKSVDNVLNTVLKAIFLSATILSAILLGLLIVPKAINGRLGDVMENLIMIAEYAIFNVILLFEHIINIFKYNFGNNFIVFIGNVVKVFSGVGFQLSFKWSAWVREIFIVAIYNIAALFENFGFCIGLLWGTLTYLWGSIKASFLCVLRGASKIISNVTKLIEFFKAKFN